MSMDIIDKAIELWRSNLDKEAIDLLESLNLEVNAKANTIIGKIYVNADPEISNIKKDYKKGKQFLLAGLKLCDADAGIELADMYYRGNGVKKNNKKAEEFWRLAYNLGDELGGFELANFYYDELNEKISDAIQIYKSLLEKGEFEENCYYKLYTIYERGIGDTIQNRELAIYYLEKGAEKGNINCCMNLGLKYYRGDGVIQDINKAIEIVERARNNEFFKKEVDIILDKMLKKEKI